MINNTNSHIEKSSMGPAEFDGYTTKAQYRGVSYYTTMADGEAHNPDLPLEHDEVAVDHSLAIYGLEVGSIIGINSHVKKVKMFIDGPEGPGIYTKTEIDEGFRVLYVLDKAS